MNTDQLTHRPSSKQNQSLNKAGKTTDQTDNQIRKLSYQAFSQNQRSRGTQTEQIPSNYVPTQILSLFNTESELAPNFFTKPHSLTTLLIFLIVVYYYSTYQTTPTGPDSYLNNTWLGMIFLYCSIVVFAIIYFPGTFTQRPHPILWKAASAFGLGWFAAVVFANFLNREDLFKFLQEFIDPGLGIEKFEKSYAEDCRIYIPDHPTNPWSNVIDKMDVFIWAHFIGWFFKMIIVRDFKLCQIQSIMFEILEITFRHWLPNFWECWWDHIFLDIIICNTGGMICGYYFLKYFKVKPYKWSLKSKVENSWFKNMKQLLIVPKLEDHEWQVFSCSWNFLAVTWYMFAMNFGDLSYFFNQYILWIEPSHQICAIRTFILGFMCIPASREYYQFTVNRDISQIGSSIWILHGILGAEMLLFLKNYQNQFIEPFPWYVIVFWSIMAVFFILTLSILLYKDIKNYISQMKEQNLKQQNQKEYNKISVPTSSEDEK